MLKCRDIAHLASDHLDNRLTWRQALRYRMHTLLCGYCRTFLRHLRTTIACGRGLAETDRLPDAEVEAIVEKTLAQVRHEVVGAGPTS